MALKNNRAPLLSNIKLYVSFHHDMWIQIGDTVRKRLSWVVTSVTLTFDLWPWPFAWTLPWSLVITPENFMMIPWWEHSQKGVTDRQTDRQTDGQTDRQTENTIHRAAWSQLKTQIIHIYFLYIYKNTASKEFIHRLYLPFRQLYVLYPGAHWHVNPLIMSVHVAPFRHGSLAHSSISEETQDLTRFWPMGKPIWDKWS